jgi:hypothetical protein
MNLGDGTKRTTKITRITRKKGNKLKSAAVVTDL